MASLSHQKDDRTGDFSSTGASTLAAHVVTRCPACATSFRVNQQQLNAVNGEVRCGICAKIFNARDNLVQKAKTGKLATKQATQVKSKQAVSYHQKINATDLQVSPFSSKISQPQTVTQGVATGQQITQDSTLDSFQQVVGDSAHSDNKGEDTDTSHTSDLENENSSDTVFLTRKKLFLLLSISLGALLLTISIFLYGYLNRDNLAQQAAYRPWLISMCYVAGCELPLFRDIANIEIINKDIRTHPSNPHTLLVRASFINKADFSQPYPILKVNLYDFNKIDVVTRHFEPLDYLSENTDIASGFPSNSRVIVELEMFDENEAAVGYEINFQ